MNEAPRISVVICTRHRADQLAQAVESVCADRRVDQLIVSSDSSLPASVEDEHSIVELTRSRFPDLDAIYQAGPRRGLAANRNAALAVAQGDYLAFIDDDARWSPAFLSAALRVAAPLCVVTGYEEQPGHRVYAHDPDFLGFQHVPIIAGAPRRCIVINSTLWPRPLIQGLGFDDFYQFGCEEIDVASRAVLAGATIEFVEEGNEHLHVPDGREGNDAAIVASRIYFGLRRFGQYERHRFRFAAFLLVAPAHAVLHAPQGQRLQAIGSCMRAVRAYNSRHPLRP